MLVLRMQHIIYVEMLEAQQLSCWSRTSRHVANDFNCEAAETRTVAERTPCTHGCRCRSAAMCPSTCKHCLSARTKRQQQTSNYSPVYIKHPRIAHNNQHVLRSRHRHVETLRAANKGDSSGVLAQVSKSVTTADRC